MIKTRIARNYDANVSSYLNFIDARFNMIVKLILIIKKKKKRVEKKDTRAIM